MPDDGRLRTKPPLDRNRMLIIVASIVALGAIAVAAIVVFGGHSTTSSTTATTTTASSATHKKHVLIVATTTTTTLPPATTTIAPPPPTTAAPPAPLVLICSGSPMFEPSTLHWCTSLCSSYVTNISWTTWTASSATGLGTLMTNNGEPNCAQGTVTAQPGFAVTLSNPQTVSYCSDSGTASGLLFTASDIWSFPIPDEGPPCG
jgi:hypothetical protein